MRKIAGVNCFGEWREDSNASCIFEDEEHDGIFDGGASCWGEVVDILQQYAEEHGTELIEVVAC